MNLFRPTKLFLPLALAGLAACSDSSGPGAVDDEAALRSLWLGLGSGSPGALPFALTPSALGTSARGIDQIDVSINGTTHSMYALGLRVTYPAGTCIESLFIVTSFATATGECNPPPFGLVLALWQTSSGSRRPEKMAFISADIGTSSFAGFSDAGVYFAVLPAFAIYINDREEFWTSVGGSLTSQVAATNETCNVAPPPFASESTCHYATFDETGQLTFERFDFTAFGPGATPAGETMSLTIPRQSIRGILQAVTRIRPVTIPDWDY